MSEWSIINKRPLQSLHTLAITVLAPSSGVHKGLIEQSEYTAGCVYLCVYVCVCVFNDLHTSYYFIEASSRERGKTRFNYRSCLYLIFLLVFCLPVWQIGSIGKTTSMIAEIVPGYIWHL